MYSATHTEGLSSGCSAPLHCEKTLSCFGERLCGCIASVKHWTLALTLITFVLRHNHEESIYEKTYISFALDLEFCITQSKPAQNSNQTRCGSYRKAAELCKTCHFHFLLTILNPSSLIRNLALQHLQANFLKSLTKVAPPPLVLHIPGPTLRDNAIMSMCHQQNFLLVKRMNPSSLVKQTFGYTLILSCCIYPRCVKALLAFCVSSPLFTRLSAPSPSSHHPLTRRNSLLVAAVPARSLKLFVRHQEHLHC